MSEAASPVGSFPEQVGKYELLLPLGTGGTATVYLARSRGVAGFEREVALKLVHAHLRSDEESRLHLLEEARLAARIRHPNVVPVTEVDSDACGVFLVMDYVEGESLSGLVRLMRDQDQRLPPRLAARIMNDALAGLHAAHELTSPSGAVLQLVHRDFSPQNILVGVEGVARLADFGVAKAASRTVRTKTGLVKGKIAYMSPEQARGYSVDRRCDVWAAGVVIWELITGRKLYEHEDDVAILLSVVTETPPRLSDVMAGIPPALDDAVASALTSDVEQRCPSAEELRLRLEKAWEQAGGMATASELGQFVKDTVAEKLAERRALLANPSAVRERTLPSSRPTALDSLVPAPLPGSSLPEGEEGTKTAISAAVPNADQFRPVGAVRRRGLWIAAALIGVVALGFAATVDTDTPPPRPIVRAAQPATEVPPDTPAPQTQVNPHPSQPAPPTRSAEDSGGAQSQAVASSDELPQAQPLPDVAAKRRATKRRKKAASAKARRKRARSRRARKAPPNKSQAASTSAPVRSTQPSKKPTPKKVRTGPPPLILAPDPYQQGK